MSECLSAEGRALGMAITESRHTRVDDISTAHVALCRLDEFAAQDLIGICGVEGRGTVRDLAQLCQHRLVYASVAMADAGDCSTSRSIQDLAAVVEREEIATAADDAWEIHTEVSRPHAGFRGLDHLCDGCGRDDIVPIRGGDIAGNSHCAGLDGDVAYTQRWYCRDGILA